MIYSLYFALAGDSLAAFVDALQQRYPLNLMFIHDNHFYPYRGEAPEHNVKYAITEVYGQNDIFLFMTDYEYEIEIEALSEVDEAAHGQARKFAGELFEAIRGLQKYHVLFLQDYGDAIDEYIP